jgi:hypothetical protein
VSGIEVLHLFKKVLRLDFTTCAARWGGFHQRLWYRSFFFCSLRQNTFGECFFSFPPFRNLDHSNESGRILEDWVTAQAGCKDQSHYGLGCSSTFTRRFPLPTPDFGIIFHFY